MQNPTGFDKRRGDFGANDRKKQKIWGIVGKNFNIFVLSGAMT